MGYPRSHVVDPLRSGIYHCISRCVRRESLIESEERCSWIVSALDRLCRVFAIDICDFAVMRNHVHLLVRTHPELTMAWSDREVARRWLCRHGGSPPGLENSIDDACMNPGLIEEWRSRLSDLGWFHKLWKEPAAKAWNRADDVTGHFWEGRYLSIGCHDENSVLMQATYILLNPVHCGMERQLGDSGRSSMGRRISKVRREIRAGLHRDGVKTYRLALLEPAIPCDPGPEPSQLSDAEWSERLALRTHSRAIREAAVAEASRTLERARRSAGSVFRGTTHGSETPLRARRVSAMSTHTSFRRRNPWRDRTSLPVLEGCSLMHFIDFVDERSRIPRIDKPFHITPGTPRLVTRILRSSRPEARESHLPPRNRLYVPPAATAVNA